MEGWFVMEGVGTGIERPLLEWEWQDDFYNARPLRGLSDDGDQGDHKGSPQQMDSGLDKGQFSGFVDGLAAAVDV